MIIISIFLKLDRHHMITIIIKFNQIFKSKNMTGMYFFENKISMIIILISLNNLQCFEYFLRYVYNTTII